LVDHAALWGVKANNASIPWWVMRIPVLGDVAMSKVQGRLINPTVDLSNLVAPPSALCVRRLEFVRETTEGTNRLALRVTLSKTAERQGDAEKARHMQLFVGLLK
jgi:hypothetical protein